MINYNFIKTDIQDFVFTLTLARPEKRNAFTPTMINEIAHALRFANESAYVRLVIIKAEGPVFCAGMDLKVFQNPELDQTNPNIENKNISLAETITNLNKPSIALVEGDVMAGGFLIALECNYIFAKKTVKFSLPEVMRGIFPFQVLASLLKYLPEKRALDLCITARIITTEEAQNLGLVYAVLHEDFNGINSKTLNLLKNQLLENSPNAIKSGIQAAKKLKELPESEKLPYLLECLSNIRTTADAKEGAAAFFEKRKPKWESS